MTRKDFQRIAKVRLIDAKNLLRTRRYSAAYYICGYVVECALKACIAKKTRRYDFPPNWSTVREEYYTHDLAKLLKAAGLEGLMTNASTGLQQNWIVAKDWSESSRYSSMNSSTAQELYDAISDPTDGILIWLEQHW